MKALVICCAVFLALSLNALAQKKVAPKQRSSVKTPTVRSTPTPATPAPKSGKCPGNGLSDDEITQMLTLHNNVRRDLKLTELKWDCRAAKFAQEWADKGVFQHRTNFDLGENIFVAQNTNESVVTAFSKWMDERANWTNSSGRCSSGKVCTHYTQIVWKNTRTVGCGINRNAKGKWGLMLVCNYDPAGNNRVGPAY